MNILKKIIKELKETNWPSKNQLLRLTIYTLIVCGIIALIILGLDLLFIEIRNYILNI
jgi:preprotein translocase SecE subunit